MSANIYNTFDIVTATNIGPQGVCIGWVQNYLFYVFSKRNECVTVRGCSTGTQRVPIEYKLFSHVHSVKYYRTIILEGKIRNNCRRSLRLYASSLRYKKQRINRKIQTSCHNPSDTSTSLSLVQFYFTFY